MSGPPQPLAGEPQWLLGLVGLPGGQRGLHVRHAAGQTEKLSELKKIFLSEPTNTWVSQKYLIEPKKYLSETKNIGVNGCCANDDNGDDAGEADGRGGQDGGEARPHTDDQNKLVHFTLRQTFDTKMNDTKICRCRYFN